MSKGIFVTATSTGVGKTVFSAVFCALLARGGSKTTYYKPVQSGAVRVGNRRQAPDCLFVNQVLSGRPGCRVHCSYLLDKPASPHFAARLEGVRISLDKIAAEYNELSATSERVVVEGAGGLYVPLDDEGALVAEIPHRLGLPTVLVAPAGLGTINHTALSHHFANAKGIHLCAVLLVYTGGTPTDIELENQVVLQKLTGVQDVLLVPAVTGVDVDRNLADGLEDKARAYAADFVLDRWFDG